MGRNFYIIIQGTVSILLKKKGLEQNPDEKFLHSNKHLLDDPSDNTEDREEILKNKKKKALLKKILAFEELTGEGLLKEQPIEISDDEYFNVRYSSFFIMRKMGNGESFGEIALRQNVPRSIFCVLINYDFLLNLL